jgi:hypothetical protein
MALSAKQADWRNPQELPQRDTLDLLRTLEKKAGLIRLVNLLKRRTVGVCSYYL